LACENHCCFDFFGGVEGDGCSCGKNNGVLLFLFLHVYEVAILGVTDLRV
jgi:hypothetical protein